MHGFNVALQARAFAQISGAWIVRESAGLAAFARARSRRRFGFVS
jgi:hypothetical protein